jgi:hypothetical protein
VTIRGHKDHSGVRKHTGRRQLGSIAGKSSIGEEAAPAMSIPLDYCSTEDHGHHLQNEVACEPALSLRRGNNQVKRRIMKTMAGCGIPILARENFERPYLWDNRRIFQQEAQKVRSARPQPMKAPEA